MHIYNIGTTISDKKLVRQSLKGKAESQRSLYERYKVSQFVLCQRYAKNRFEAEDFLQEGFIQFFKDLHQYKAEKGPLKPWMNRVFINKCLQLIRKKKQQPFMEEITDYNESLSYEPETLSNLARKDLINLLNTLPSGYRTVFNLYVIDGYKHSEIAKLLKISESTSKSQLFKAKKLLISRLQIEKKTFEGHG